MWKHIKGILFHLFPHHLLSRITFWLTRLESPLKNSLIRLFIRVFSVDMSEATHSRPEDYASFNNFFVRKLQPNARPISKDQNSIICPADGKISQIGNYQNDRIIQAKGKYFSMQKLLGGVTEYPSLTDCGNFATIYLSPKNYHRVHMPFDGKLVEMIYIPGRLFSVAPYSSEVIAGLYSRNERVISLFSTIKGLMAVVMVGAVNVSAIEMSWAGLVTPPHKKSISRKKFPNVELKKGEEMGIFNMGSTVIVAFESDTIHWEQALTLQQEVKMGQAIGHINH